MERRPWAGERGGGCCGKCGQPPARCVCRECRKEAKSLTVTDTGEQHGDQGEKVGAAPSLLAGFKNNTVSSAISIPLPAGGVGKGFIGGDCCVSLTVECAATDPTTASNVVVGVGDTEGTELLWFKTLPAGTSYKVYEGVITTNPGATLYVFVSDCTVRVRWCEVFSC
jgi:hypothetical protein